MPRDNRPSRFRFTGILPVPLQQSHGTAGGEVRWMEVRDWLKHVSENGKKPVKQIVFRGERFDIMSVRRWRGKILHSAALSTLEPQ